MKNQIQLQKVVGQKTGARIQHLCFSPCLAPCFSQIRNRRTDRILAPLPRTWQIAAKQLFFLVFSGCVLLSEKHSFPSPISFPRFCNAITYNGCRLFAYIKSAINNHTYRIWSFFVMGRNCVVEAKYWSICLTSQMWELAQRSFVFCKYDLHFPHHEYESAGNRLRPGKEIRQLIFPPRRSGYRCLTYCDTLAETLVFSISN